MAIMSQSGDFLRLSSYPWAVLRYRFLSNRVVPLSSTIVRPKTTYDSRSGRHPETRRAIQCGKRCSSRCSYVRQIVGAPNEQPPIAADPRFSRMSIAEKGGAAQSNVAPPAESKNRCRFKKGGVCISVLVRVLRGNRCASLAKT
jgi:hypothetical protein